jgi:hypothetical protein
MSATQHKDDKCTEEHVVANTIIVTPETSASYSITMIDCTFSQDFFASETPLALAQLLTKHIHPCLTSSATQYAYPFGDGRPRNPDLVDCLHDIWRRFYSCRIHCTNSLAAIVLRQLCSREAYAMDYKHY